MKQIRRNWCEYGDHEITPFSALVYTDEDHGVAEDTQTCRKCYAEHILKYYPDSRVAARIRSHPEDYKLVE